MSTNPLNPFDHLDIYPMGPGFTRKLLGYQAGENGYTVNMLTGEAGHGAPAHNHPHLQFNYMIKGAGDFVFGDDIIPMKAGDCIMIPSGVMHTFKEVTEDAVWLEFFTPEREDFAPEA